MATSSETKSLVFTRKNRIIRMLTGIIVFVELYN